MKPEDLKALEKELDELEPKLGVARGPQTDDELHEWIKQECGVNIPRVAVCEGHQAPFDFVADAFFERVKSALVLASREGMKTLGIACLWRAKAKFRPGIEMLTAGAIEAQSKRLYGHVKNTLRLDPGDLDLKHHPDLIEAPMQSLTRWKNHSVLEIVAGSVRALNGPHPNNFHFDEAELAEPQAFEESRNISSTKNGIPKQDFITSTRKSKHGVMQKLLDEVDEAKRLGSQPPYEVYVWCCPWDTPVECPRDRNEWPDGIPIALLKPGQPVWSFNEEKEEFELKPVKHVMKTGEQREVWRLILDTGEVIRATPEHLLLKRDGKWCELGKLKPGDSLMPLYQDDEPQFKTKPNSASSPSVSEFRLIREIIGSNSETHVHHKDGWRNNTSLENLEALSCSEHHLKEWENRRKRAEELGISPALGDNEARRESVARSWLEANEDDLKSRIEKSASGLREAWAKGFEFSDKPCRGCNESFTPRSGRQLYCENCRMAALVPPENHGNSHRSFEPKECIDCGEGFAPRSGRSIRCDDCRLKVKNHVVVAVEFDSIQDVWDIEVEDNHNFVVGGIVLHNCFVEANENVPNCRVANPDLSEEQKCNCNKVIKGTWDDGTPRRFDQVCRGRLAKSQGYAPLEDTQGVFLQSSRGTWEAQRECTKPDIQGLVFPQFSRGKHGIRNFTPDPRNGPFFQWIDWGGAESQQAVGWCQLLKYDIDVVSYEGKKKRLKQGTLVLFDELYELGIGNLKLADMVIDRERHWRSVFSDFRVKYRFPDPQGWSARDDFKSKGLPTYWDATRDIKTQINLCKEIIEDDLLAVDVGRCPFFLDEMEYYHYPDKKAGMIDNPEIPVDDFNHMVAGFRYAVANLNRMKKKAKAARGSSPAAAGEGYAPVGGTKNIPVVASSRRYLVNPRGMERP